MLQWLKKIEKPAMIIVSILTIFGMITTAAYYVGYSKAKYEAAESIAAMQHKEIEMCDKYNQTIYDLRMQILEQKEQIITLKQE